VYAPKLPREKTEQQIVGDLLDRAFGGSSSRLVMRALSSRRASPEELDRIRELLNEIEEESE
jgi:predicted transcriptional regulator